MKFAIVVLACVVACASAQFNRASAFASFNQGNQYNRLNQQRYQPTYKAVTPAPYRPVAPVPVVPVAPQAYARVSVNDARAANTLKYGNEVNPDGSYNYYYETENGIAAQEQGIPRNFGGNPPVVPDVAQGSFSWTSPEGKLVSITYVADENGYQPSGDAIPQPPPIPPQIARALEYIARNARNQK